MKQYLCHKIQLIFHFKPLHESTPVVQLSQYLYSLFLDPPPPSLPLSTLHIYVFYYPVLCSLFCLFTCVTCTVFSLLCVPCSVFLVFFLYVPFSVFFVLCFFVLCSLSWVTLRVPCSVFSVLFFLVL